MNAAGARRRQAGMALVAALFLAAGVALFASALFGITFLDGTSSANHVVGEIAFYAAEAGIEHVRALLPPAPDFAAELGWSGGAPPFGAVVDFPAPPTSYRVSVLSVTPDRMHLRAVGTAARGAERSLDVSLCREQVFTPSAPFVLAPAFTAGIGGGSTVLDGADRDGRAATTAPLAIERAADRVAAETFLGRPPIEIPLGSGLGAAATALGGSADRVESGPFTDATFGDAPTPLVTRLTGDANVLGSSTASGILVAEAPLRVRGRLGVSGIVLATAGLTVEGELDVAGLLYAAGDVDLLPGSRLHVVAASGALDTADGLRPGVLPRAAVFCGWREVW